MKKFNEIREARRSAQDRLSARAAKHGLGSQKRLDKIKKSADFFSKPPPSFSKAELKKMGYAVEGRFDIEIPAPKGMKGRKNPTRTALNKKLSAKHADKIAKNAKRDQARSARAGGALTRKGHNDNSYKKGVTGKFFSTQPAFESADPKFDAWFKKSQELDKMSKDASKKLKKFPRGSTGLTPDAVKKDPKFKKAKADADNIHRAIQKHNTGVSKDWFRMARDRRRQMK
jgi:hypothetical protein